MIALIKNIWKFLRHHSYRELLNRLCRLMVKPFYESTARYIVKLDLRFAADPDPNLHTKELVSADTDNMLKVMYISRSSLQRRLECGDRCFAVIDNGQILSYFWAHFGLKNFQELHLNFRLLTNQTWMYNAITVKAARGRGLYPNTIRYMAKVLQKSGIDEAFIDVDSKNCPSIRGLEKAGCTRVALIHMKKILSKTVYKITVFDNSTWCRLSQIIENFDSLQRIVENIT
ncbi:MAG: hypothetical protein ABSE89_05625 [Sedimentisphaerales bacterium]